MRDGKESLCRNLTLFSLESEYAGILKDLRKSLPREQSEGMTDSELLQLFLYQCNHHDGKFDEEKEGPPQLEKWQEVRLC